MHRDVRRRYQTAGELVADLERFLDGRPPARRDADATSPAAGTTLDVVDGRTGEAIASIDAADGDAVPIALAKDRRTVGQATIVVRL